MSIAFLVDGNLEKKVVQRLCGDVPVRITNLNGKNVTIDAISVKLASLMRLLKGRHFPIVIIVDREQRPESSLGIETRLEQLLVQQGFNSADFLVSCPDRMIENWIVAGTTTWSGKPVDLCSPGTSIDGNHGKGVVRAFLSDHKSPYGETTTGVEMFCAMSFNVAADRSASYGRLHSKIRSYCPKLRAQQS